MTLGAGIAVQKTLRFLKAEDIIKSICVNSPLIDKIIALIWLFLSTSHCLILCL